MKIEILEDILEELADKLGVYGCCKPAENEEDCNSQNGFCCRTGFMMNYEDRIRTALDNEEKLNKIGLTNTNKE